jgi:Bifunctional DNA primase/polymerase, N-terminal
MSELAVRLRDAAAGYVREGWPILPVDNPTGSRLICQRCPADEATVHDWWSDQPYGIAGRTGTVFDALELPAHIGQKVLDALAQNGPPAVIPAVVEVPLTSNWLFLVTPGSPRIFDLPSDCGVRLHGKDRWILLPPTPVLGGTVSWVGHADQRRLPHSMNAQWAALRALVSVRRQPASRSAADLSLRADQPRPA